MTASDAPARTRRRLPPAARREQIVRAARAVILRRGLTATSLRDIAAEADVAVGTVTYHFASVAEILGAVVVEESARFYERVVERADAEQEPWAALAILTDPLFADDADVEDHWRIWTDYWAATARDPEQAASYAVGIRHWERCCTRVIARGVASGAFREVDPAEAALKLAAYSDGLATQRAQGVPSLTPQVAHAWFAEFASGLLSPRA